MFAWGKIAVAGVIFIASVTINVDAGFISYNVSGFVINTTNEIEESFVGICTFKDVDYRDYDLYNPNTYFEYPIRDFFIESETFGTFSGSRGSLSCFTHDTYLQLLGTGFTDELYGDIEELNWNDKIDGWKNIQLRDNYSFPCWRLDNNIWFQNIILTKTNNITEPGAHKFMALGMLVLFLFPAGVLKTRYLFTEHK